MKKAFLLIVLLLLLTAGFLSSPSDRSIIVNNPQLSAQGIAEGILNYLKAQNLLQG